MRRLYINVNLEEWLGTEQVNLGLLKTAATPSLKAGADCPWDSVGLFKYITPTLQGKSC